MVVAHKETGSKIKGKKSRHAKKIHRKETRGHQLTAKELKEASSA